MVIMIILTEFLVAARRLMKKREPQVPPSWREFTGEARKVKHGHSCSNFLECILTVIRSCMYAKIKSCDGHPVGPPARRNSSSQYFGFRQHPDPRLAPSACVHVYVYTHTYEKNQNICHVYGICYPAMDPPICVLCDGRTTEGFVCVRT